MTTINLTHLELSMLHSLVQERLKRYGPATSKSPQDIKTTLINLDQILTLGIKRSIVGEEQPTRVDYPKAALGYYTDVIPPGETWNSGNTGVTESEIPTSYVEPVEPPTVKERRNAPR